MTPVAYMIVTGKDDNNMDRKRTVKRCKQDCHRDEKPLQLKTTEDDEEYDEAPDLIDTDDEEDVWEDALDDGFTKPTAKTATTTGGDPTEAWYCVGDEDGKTGRLRSHITLGEIQIGAMEVIPAVLNGFPTVLLYDTGTSICTIPKEVVNRIGLQQLIKHTRAAQCNTAGGEMNISEEIQLDVMMQGATRLTQFMVMPEENPN